MLGHLGGLIMKMKNLENISFRGCQKIIFGLISFPLTGSQSLITL